MVRIALWNPYVFQWKLSAFLAKGPKSTPESLWITTFSERDFRVAENDVSPLEKSRNGKSKTRSETLLFSNGNGVLSWQNYKKEFRITAIYNVFRTRFPTCGKWSSPIGKVKKMESRNRVLKHICFPMETDHNSGKITKRCSGSIVFYNVFRPRIPIPQNPMKTKGFGIPKMHFFSGYPGISFRGLLRSRIPGSLELPEISFREGGGYFKHARISRALRNLV